MKKVVNIGGVFLKSSIKDKMNDWYRNNLGLNIEDFGAIMKFRDFENAEDKKYSVFSIFPEDSEYFKPSNQSYMINFIVDDLTALVNELLNDGVEIIGKIENTEYGKFAWILDPDGNKIELWEQAKST